jgi:predicted transcriptional regulator
VLPAGNRDLLRVIAEKAPASLDELAHLTDRKRSNLSHTRRTMAGYGLVRLERGERERIAPKLAHDPDGTGTTPHQRAGATAERYRRAGRCGFARAYPRIIPPS